eukprot:UN20599
MNNECPEVSLAGKKKRNKRKRKGKKKRKNKNKGGESEDSEEECPEVMCRMYCEHGWVTDEDGCSICQCADAPVTPEPRQLGETCGYVYGPGFVGDCADGLKCACVGNCADPRIADAPTTCIEEPSVDCSSERPEPKCEGDTLVTFVETDNADSRGCMIYRREEIVCGME